jgi:copper(I)-binding protein
MMRRKIPTPFIRLAGACALLSIIAGGSPAQSERQVSVGDLIIAGAWMPPPLQGARAAAIYLRIENRGSEADQLLGAVSPVAQDLTVHQSKESGGIMKMLPRSSIEIPPHGEVELKPMGIHLMAMGLKANFKDSGSFPITLKFKRAGSVTVDVVVTRSRP